MEITIKNMVCPRCIMAVTQVLDTLEMPYSEVSLGKVVLNYDLSDSELIRLEVDLDKLGFEIIKDENQKLVDQMKTIIIQNLHQLPLDTKSLSEWISAVIPKDFGSLSKVFSSSEGMPLEKYFLKQKIEKVKELLSYNENNLSEIADLLSYSSVAHLSSQFKKITGITPSEFKKQSKVNRKSIDSIS